MQSVLLYTFGDDKCGETRKVRVIGGVQLGGMSGATDLGMWKDAATKADEGRYFEIVIPAEQVFYFNVRGSHWGAICDVTQSFIPKQDRQYEVVFTRNTRSCLTRVSQLMLEGENLKRGAEQSWKRNQVTCSSYMN